MALVSTPAVLLRSYPFGETSRILRFFTRDLGIAGVVARGISARQRRAGSPFTTYARGYLTVYVKTGRDLHNLKEFTPLDLRGRIGRSALHLGGAGLVAELVLRHSGEEANVELFEALDGALQRLAITEGKEVVPYVLAAAWWLVGLMGYQPALEACVECGRTLRAREVGVFDFGSGGVRCDACAGGNPGPRVGPRAREQLRALARGEVPEDIARVAAHLQLFGDFVTYHVSGSRPLDSVAFLRRILSEARA